MIMHKIEKSRDTINFNKPIFEDDEETLYTITKRLQKHISDASKVFNSALKLQKRRLNKTIVELVNYFNSEVKQRFAGANYTIAVVHQPFLKLNVKLDLEAFNDALENLIENAKVHGFENPAKQYQIVFELSAFQSLDDENQATTDYARIVYSNNGKSFPTNYTFEEYKQYSNKAGKTQGTGIGGSVVNRIIELHNGKFNAISLGSETSPFAVQFEILLPLET